MKGQLFSGKMEWKDEGGVLTSSGGVSQVIKWEEVRLLRWERGKDVVWEKREGEMGGLLFSARPKPGAELGLVLKGEPPMERVHAQIQFLGERSSELRNFLKHDLRWEGWLVPPRSGLYTFHLASSVKGSLWVDREWVCGLKGESNAVMEVSGQIPLQAGHRHEVVLWLESEDRIPQCQLEWESADVSRSLIPAGQWLHRSGLRLARKVEHGILATYFGNPDFHGARVIRVEPIPGGYWGALAPMADRGVPERFSVTYSGTFFPPEKGDYSFYLDMEGGGRLTVAAQVQYEWWTDSKTSIGTLGYALEGRKANTFLLEFFNQDGPAKVVFRLMRRGEGFLGLLPEWFRPALPPLEHGRELRVGVRGGALEAGTGILEVPRTSPTGVVLVDGSVLAQLPTTASGREMYFAPGQRVDQVSLGNVAAVRWLGSVVPLEDVPDFRGARLANGEVVEGDFQGLDVKELKLGSVLFGNRGVERERLESLVLRGVQKVKPKWYVYLVDGSRWGVAEWKVGEGGMEVQGLVLGRRKLVWGDVLAVERAL